MASLCLCVSCFVCTKGRVTGFRATCSRRTHQVPQKSRCTHPVFTQSHSHRSWALGLRNTFILGKVSAPFHDRQEQGELQSFLGVGDEENQGDVIFPLLPRVLCPRTVIKGEKREIKKRDEQERRRILHTDEGAPYTDEGAPIGKKRKALRGAEPGPRPGGGGAGNAWRVGVIVWRACPRCRLGLGGDEAPVQTEVSS